MSAVLDKARKDIDKRLKELQPAVDEFNELETIRERLSEATTGNGPSNPRSRRAPVAEAPRRGRPRGTGKRGGQVLDILSRNKKGMTIPTLAKEMGIQPNYLYRLLPSMEHEGKVKRGDNKKWVRAD